MKGVLKERVLKEGPYHEGSSEIKSSEGRFLS
jgi:hypothetical protein